MANNQYVQALGPATQTQQADKRQVQNSAGGFSFKLDPLDRLRRFLVLGSDSPTYYASARQATAENVENIKAIFSEEELGLKAVDMIVTVSSSYLAPKNDPALVALAVASASQHRSVRDKALRSLPRVARTGTHLFNFLTYLKSQRGWGSAVKKAVAAWYERDNLDLQLVKYRQRDGWTHRDVLRVSHPDPGGPNSQSLAWVAGKGEAPAGSIIEAFEKAQKANSVDEVISLVTEFKLPWETIPTGFLNETKLWDVLFPHLGANALVRQLPRLSAIGWLEPMGANTAPVVNKLTDSSFLKTVHPIQILNALKAYGLGSNRNLNWKPVPEILAALDEGFYAAFENVVPANKNTMLALDVSGSMSWNNVAGMALTPAEASAAMAAVTLNTEPNVITTAFSSGGAGWATTRHSQSPDGISMVPLHKKMSLAEVTSSLEGLNFGGTDCSLPMIWAQRENVAIDTFVVYTDNETWAGKIHPHEALRDYRNKMGLPNAKLIVVGMVSNGFTIADPGDPRMLDVVGFDASAPNLMASFSRGEI